MSDLLSGVHRAATHGTCPSGCIGFWSGPAPEVGRAGGMSTPGHNNRLLLEVVLERSAKECKYPSLQEGRYPSLLGLVGSPRLIQHKE